jgi:iron(III) transport system ATP-binding protein
MSTDAPAERVAALAVDGVAKAFGRGADRTVAVDHVSLTLDPHELVALVGPSGCGKSTLLRLLAGLLAVDAGTIALNGRIVDDGRTSIPPERRNIGLVFQEHALFPHLTIADNVGFGVRQEATGPRVVEMLDLVGLATHADRYPHELSGGERQRVALARALAPRPSLMLLDEPFASLDPNLRAQIRDDVVGILRSTRTPAVFVTHDQGEALAVGDRIAVMRSGRIEQIGTPEHVFHTPTSRFVASFMGEADFLSADDLRALGAATATAPVAMVRPDDVTFAATDGGRATVVAAEFRGTMWCYTLRLDNGHSVRSTRSHLDRVAVGTRVEPVLLPGHEPVPISD